MRGIDAYRKRDILDSMEQTDLLAYVVSSLRAIGPKGWPEVSVATGKPISTLRKIAYGDRKNPRLDTIEPIANYCRERVQ